MAMVDLPEMVLKAVAETVAMAAAETVVVMAAAEMAAVVMEAGSSS